MKLSNYSTLIVLSIVGLSACNGETDEDIDTDVDDTDTDPIPIPIPIPMSMFRIPMSSVMRRALRQLRTAARLRDMRSFRS